MTQLEKEIEGKLVKAVKASRGLCLKWVCPGWAGVPDRILLLPRGRIFFVETKRPKGGGLSARQKWWHTTLRVLGFSCWVAWTLDDVEYIVQKIQRKEDWLE